jgi:hypothetical protein
MLASIDPSPCCVDLGVRLNGRHNRRCRDINFAGSLDDLLRELDRLFEQMEEVQNSNPDGVEGPVD